MGNKLSKKVGPLPVWAWALVVIGGVLAAKYLKGQRSTASASADVAQGADTYSGSGDFGSGGGAGAGGGGIIVQPNAQPVAGGYADSGHSDDYMGLLTTAIDSLSGKQDTAVSVLGGSLDNAVGGLVDTNTALIDSFGKRPINVSIKPTVKVPTDKGGKRTLAPHHKVAVEKPLPIKPGAPKPSTKVTHPTTVHPQAKPAVRPVVHTVASGQGSAKPKTSPAIKGGGGGGHSTMV